MNNTTSDQSLKVASNDAGGNTPVGRASLRSTEAPIFATILGSLDENRFTTNSQERIIKIALRICPRNSRTFIIGTFLPAEICPINTSFQTHLRDRRGMYELRKLENGRSPLTFQKPTHNPSYGWNCSCAPKHGQLAA